MLSASNYSTIWPIYIESQESAPSCPLNRMEKSLKNHSKVNSLTPYCRVLSTNDILCNKGFGKNKAFSNPL